MEEWPKKNLWKTLLNRQTVTGHTTSNFSDFPQVVVGPFLNALSRTSKLE